MFSNYMYPFYRSPFGFGGINQGIGFPGFGFSGFNPGFGFGSSFTGVNAIGSAIANQSMNVIGTGAIGGSQIATPTVIW